MNSWLYCGVHVSVPFNLLFHMLLKKKEYRREEGKKACKDALYGMALMPKYRAGTLRYLLISLHLKITFLLHLLESPKVLTTSKISTFSSEVLLAFQVLVQK